MNKLDINKVRVGFWNYPNLIPIIEHFTGVIERMRSITNENLFIVFNNENKFFELHNFDKFRREHQGEMPSTFEYTFPPEITQITEFMIHILMLKDQTRNRVLDRIAQGKRLEREKKASQNKRLVREFTNTFIY